MNKVKCLLFLLTIPFLQHCKPPLEELYKFYSPFDRYSYFENYNLYYLSPLHGSVGAEGDFLKKMWLSCKDKKDEISSTEKLLTTLCIVEEGDEFLATAYQPYGRFTPTTISILVSKAYDNSLFKRNKKNTYKNIKTLTKSFKGPGNPKRVQNLIELIEKSLKEENSILQQKINNEQEKNLFPHGTTFQILLAFLYLQSDTAQDLQEYTHHISHYLSLYANYNESRNLINLSSYNDIPWQNSPEAIITHKIIEKNSIPYGPPSLYWKRKIAYEQQKPISDCCETAIREILNILIYDPLTKSFNLSRLPSRLNKKLPESIIQFYKKYSKAETSDDVNNLQNHRDWLDVVSKLPDIEYRKKEYEINPCLINIMMCISIICGMSNTKNRSLKPKEFVEKVCKRLSNDSLYTLNPITIYHDDTNDSTDIVFKFLSHNQMQEEVHHSFTLHIRKDHAWIKHTPPATAPFILIEQGLAPVTVDYLIAERIKEKMNNFYEFHPALNDLLTLYAEQS